MGDNAASNVNSVQVGRRKLQLSSALNNSRARTASNNLRRLPHLRDLPESPALLAASFRLIRDVGSIGNPGDVIVGHNIYRLWLMVLVDATDELIGPDVNDPTSGGFQISHEVPGVYSYENYGPLVWEEWRWGGRTPGANSTVYQIIYSPQGR